MISSTGTAMAFQPDSTVPSVAGMSLVMITCCAFSRGLLASAFIDASSPGTSVGARCVGLSR